MKQAFAQLEPTILLLGQMHVAESQSGMISPMGHTPIRSGEWLLNDSVLPGGRSNRPGGSENRLRVDLGVLLKAGWPTGSVPRGAPDCN